MWNTILNYLLECIFIQKKSIIQQSYFSKGSYTMMGGTEEDILKECELLVISLIKKFDKPVETSSNKM